jgi:hypothetical protein
VVSENDLLTVVSELMGTLVIIYHCRVFIIFLKIRIGYQSRSRVEKDTHLGLLKAPCEVVNDIRDFLDAFDRQISVIPKNIEGSQRGEVLHTRIKRFQVAFKDIRRKGVLLCYLGRICTPRWHVEEYGMLGV